MGASAACSAIAVSEDRYLNRRIHAMQEKGSLTVAPLVQTGLPVLQPMNSPTLVQTFLNSENGRYVKYCAASTLATWGLHPLDVMSTRKQCEVPPAPRRGLFRGVGVAVVNRLFRTVGLGWSMGLVQRHSEGVSPLMSWVLTVGAGAGLETVLNPLSVVKQDIVIGRYDRVRSVFLHRTGPSLFNGSGVVFLRNSGFNALFVWGMNSVKRSEDGELETAAKGAAVGLGSACATFPVERVRCIMATESTGKIQDMWRALRSKFAGKSLGQAVGELYRGAAPALLRMPLMTAFTALTMAIASKRD
ncbi:MAG: MC/SLC25 family protein [Candidatus Margulisiibacteriota bacterium]